MFSPQRGKDAFFSITRAMGISSRVLASEWRRQRVLIVGYHGVSLADEHVWDGRVYISPGLLRERLALLERERCTVLALSEAIDRLYLGTLPPRSVVLTFDDGFYDFYRCAAPILNEFGYPATVYWTTYYSGFNRPVFDVMLRYLLWKGRETPLILKGVVEKPVLLNDPARFMQIKEYIRSFAFQKNLSGVEKDELLIRIAGALGIDYDELCRQRLLHLMTPAEAAEVAAQGHQLELHTHRHRVSRYESYFKAEIRDNRDFIASATGFQPSHFCYPGGFWEPIFLTWLREAGIRSSTTCQPGLASRDSDPLLLPRLMDTSYVSENVFYAWITGIGARLPIRKQPISTDQLLEETLKRLPEMEETETTQSC